VWQSEPIVPTARPETSQETIKATLSLPNFATLPSLPKDALTRFGVGVPYPPLQREIAAKLQLGSYLSWRVSDTPLQSDKTQFWQMIRLSEAGFRPDAVTIEQVATSHPGSLWLIGNEPDVIWQDNVTPERYAELYHDLYYLLKESDPTSQVAIGVITQPTPLLLQYLERVLASYQQNYAEAMQVDVWNVHNFILPEKRDSWGVEIPPGMSGIDKGMLYDIDDHDNMAIFKSQLINFRQWLANQGQKDKPLIVSEYGILMPEDYGFPFERVQRFLYETYTFMLTATDEKIGYAADEYRLVQGWAWYSLSDDRYPTGNFIDFTTGNLTELGRAHQAYMDYLGDLKK
jgi:hypothetical protein